MQVNDVIKALGGGQGAAQFLKTTLSNIKSLSKDCSSNAEDVDKRFSDWLGYVQELHAATLAGETDNDIKRAANQTQLLAAQAQQTANEKAVEGAKKAMDELGETLTTTREAYKKASDEFPSGKETPSSGQWFEIKFRQDGMLLVSNLLLVLGRHSTMP